MSTSRRRRRPVVALPPRTFRQKLAADQVRDLSMALHQNLDAIAKGQADEGILWQQVGGTMTWSRVADLLGLGAPEMAAQMRLLEILVDRYRVTGRVEFQGSEYDLARDGVVVMDLLASTVDLPTALRAAAWGEYQMNALKNRVTQPLRGAV